MANELPNAVALMRDATFMDWVRAGSVYVARTVLTEPDTTASHDVRVRMAQAIVLDPTAMQTRLVNILATDPDVASIGDQVGEGPNMIGQNLIIQKIIGVWTPLAKLVYPNPAVP